ncbi:hypothetical protein JTE90_015028 [Oedothorax gibbosus]|uniref:DNA endonuclease activator Ctp1 C-terminal domain-containing protein n=1 Tax=Oedothorax gibbosus TaxID=931172 RepID=A0AAV6TXE4_9ARAC|nr:hypothetical protein JTE90_015028 [Oedothorax gibbosus]
MGHEAKVDDFNRVPACALTKRQYRRRCMQGDVCRECQPWFDAFGGVRESSRHRVSARRPPTPPGFWSMDFADDDAAIPIEKCLLPQKHTNKYDQPVVPKPASRPPLPDKQGWTRAVKPQPDDFE